MATRTRVGTEKGRRTTESTKSMLDRKNASESYYSGVTAPVEHKYDQEEVMRQVTQRLKDQERQKKFAEGRKRMTSDDHKY